MSPCPDPGMLADVADQPVYVRWTTALASLALQTQDVDTQLGAQAGLAATAFVNKAIIVEAMRVSGVTAGGDTVEYVLVDGNPVILDVAVDVDWSGELETGVGTTGNYPTVRTKFGKPFVLRNTLSFKASVSATGGEVVELWGRAVDRTV